MNIPHSLQSSRPLTKLSALMLATLVVLAAALAGPFMSNASASSMSCPADSHTIVCTIVEPDVQHNLSFSYPQLTLQTGWHVTIRAGGCYQTGGHGKTWKRFLDPLSGEPNMYKGIISIPGTIGPAFLSDVQNRTFTVQRNTQLGIGVKDDGYSDNGYWGRSGDDGTYNQCLGAPNAWVQLVITND